MSVALPGSPLAALKDRVSAGLADDLILCACPHPAAPGHLCLFLPSRVLCCEDCTEAVRDTADEQPPRCAICPGPATRTTVWMDGRVVVFARLCEMCGTVGNTPMSRN